MGSVIWALFRGGKGDVGWQGGGEDGGENEERGGLADGIQFA